MSNVENEDKTSRPQDDSAFPDTVQPSLTPTTTQGLNLNKISIKTKFFNTLILSIICLSAVSGIGLFSSAQLTNSLTEQQANSSALERQGEVYKMHNALNADALNLVLFAHAYDESKDKSAQVDAFEKVFESHKKTLLDNLNANATGTYNDDIAKMSKSLLPDFETYFEKLDEIEAATRFLLAVQNDNSEKAMKEKKDLLIEVNTLYRTEFRALFNKLETGGDKIEKAFEDRAAELNNTSTNIKTWAFLAQLGVALFSIALLAWLNSNLFKNLNAKISEILGMIEKMKANDLQLNYTKTDRDELYSIGEALTESAQSLGIAQAKERELAEENQVLLEKVEKENKGLNDSIVALLMTMFELTKKDLSVRATVSEDVVGTIADSINMVISSTNKALSETASVAGMVETASNNTQEKSTEIYNLSVRSKEVVSSVIADFETSLTDIRLMATIAAESKIAAEQATESTLEALKIVKDTVGSMGSIRDTISNTETKIKKLAERSQEIGFIVELIGDISERTHVLSLNAAIQAAIAGDAGRGFAAIAGEIQKLAENTKEATQRIARLVSNIQVETSETIQMVNQTIDKVVNGVQLAEASGSQMTETQNKTATLAKSVLQISTAIVEHEKATNHMKTGAESLSSAQEDFSTAAQDQLMQARSLLAFARRLKENVEEFKLN